jgi:predicted MFS family arabinose efflux permease
MTIFLIILLAVLNQISFGGTRVAVSLYALDQGAEQFTVGTIIALFALMPTLLAISIGKIADRTAPRVLMILASVINLAALLFPWASTGLPVLFVMALVLGLTHPMFLIPLEAAVGGVGGGGQRVRNYALLTMGWSVANFLGPVIGGISIDLVGHRPAFLVLGSLTLASTLMLCFLPALLPKSVARAGQHADARPRGSVLELWRMPPVRATLVASAIVGSAMDLFQFYFPIYGHAIGLSASAIGSIIGVVSIASFVIRGALPFLVKRITEADVLVYSAFITAAAFACMPFSTNPYALAVFAFMLGLGVGCANPMTMSLLYALTPPARIAEAIGLNKTLRNFTHLTIPLASGSLGGAFGFITVFLTNAAMMGIGGVIVRKMGVPDTDRERK